MSQNLAQLYAKQYATNVALLLQQKGSKLRGLVTEGQYHGEQASPVDQMGSVEMQEVVGKFGPMGRVDAAFDRRWVAPSAFELPQLIDTFDKAKLAADPTSQYSVNAQYAAGRKMDDMIISALFGTAKTGKDGTTSTSFPSGQQVAVNFGAASNTGATVAKLREAKRILMANQVDLDSDPLTAIVTAKQHDNLLSEIQVISLDFNDKPVMVEGRITRFLGINIVHCERLGVDGSNYRRMPIFAKSGMHLGFWNQPETSIDQRKDLSGLPWQIYLKMMLGATRLEEGRVVEVKCDETV